MMYDIDGKRQRLVQDLESLIARLDHDEHEKIIAIADLISKVDCLAPGEVKAIDSLADIFREEKLFWRNECSDIISEEMLEGIGARIRMHHAMSFEAFTKDKFEFAMIGAARDLGLQASKAGRGNPGHDVTIGSTRYSLKTQANAEIKVESIWISKYRELGQGEWTDIPSQLYGLLDQFLEHLTRYDRILTLRRLPSSDSTEYYELVEIPKALLDSAKHGRLEMKTYSEQKGAKPGYCYVERDGSLLFQLYFDGGTERKLQVQHLLKRECFIHAEWKFKLPNEVALAKMNDRIESEEEKRRKREEKLRKREEGNNSPFKRLF